MGAIPKVAIPHHLHDFEIAMQNVPRKYRPDRKGEACKLVRASLVKRQIDPPVAASVLEAAGMGAPLEWLRAFLTGRKVISQ